MHCNLRPFDVTPVILSFNYETDNASACKYNNCATSTHRSRIRYLSKKIANFNEFYEIKKFVKIRTKIR